MPVAALRAPDQSRFGIPDRRLALILMGVIARAACQRLKDERPWPSSGGGSRLAGSEDSVPGTSCTGLENEGVGEHVRTRFHLGKDCR